MAITRKLDALPSAAAFGLGAANLGALPSGVAGKEYGVVLLHKITEIKIFFKKFCPKMARKIVIECRIDIL